MAARSSSRTRPTNWHGTEADAGGRRPRRVASHLTREALGYPAAPGLHRKFHPDALWEIERPWWRNPVEPRPEGPFGTVIPQSELYRRMAEADAFQLFRLDGSNSGLPIYDGATFLGSMTGAHDEDESLTASVLLENLACKATGALALEHLLAQTAFPADDIEYAIGCGEEAVGDRYQRGGAISRRRSPSRPAAATRRAATSRPSAALRSTRSSLPPRSSPRESFPAVAVVGLECRWAKLDEVRRRRKERSPGARRRARRSGDPRRPARRGFPGAAPRRGRPAPRSAPARRSRLSSRTFRRPAARGARPRHSRRRPLCDRAPRPGDHRAGRRGQRPEP